MARIWYKAGLDVVGEPGTWPGRVAFDPECPQDGHTYYPEWPSEADIRHRPVERSNAVENIRTGWWVEDPELNYLQVAAGL